MTFSGYYLEKQVHKVGSIPIMLNPEAIEISIIWPLRQAHFTNKRYTQVPQSVFLSGRKFCHLMLLALKSTQGEGRHHKKKCLSTCCSGIGGGTFEPHLQFFGLADCDVYVCVYGPSVSPHKQVGFPATDIEFPSLITHYRLH